MNRPHQPHVHPSDNSDRMWAELDSLPALYALGATDSTPRIPSQRAAYIAGRTDVPDPLAPARGVLVGVGLTVASAFVLGMFWPLGSWVAAGAW